MKKKRILFGSEASNKLRIGIEKIEKAVGSTLGARGRTVLIESEMHTAGITATKDGITVARAINLEDPTEQLAVRLIRQAAHMTASQAGDGTTTSVVLAAAMIRETDALLNARRWFWQKKNNYNITEITRNMDIIANNIAREILEDTTNVDQALLYNVATVSSNNDEVIGKAIGDAYKKVGKDGIVLADNSKTEKTHTTLTKGTQFKRGLLSPFHMTNSAKQVCEMTNVAVLVTDLRIPSAVVIQPIIDYVLASGKSLLIVGELEKDARETLDHNISRGLLRACYVNPPDFGDRRTDMMSDLAVATGGKYVTERTGSDWSSIGFKDLGVAKRVVVDRETTSIMHENEDAAEAVQTLVADLRKQLKEGENESEKEIIDARIANLCGSIATIYVGGKTDVEQKERRDRVDDAVLATKAAMEEGISPGGGVTLLDWSNDIFIDEDNINMIAAKKIMSAALKAPFNQIMINAGKNPKEIIAIHNVGGGWGYDVKEERSGGMIEMGIIDPTKVVRKSLLNATSVAETTLMTSAIITDIPEK